MRIVLPLLVVAIATATILPPAGWLNSIFRLPSMLGGRQNVVQTSIIQAPRNPMMMQQSYGMQTMGTNQMMMPAGNAYQSSMYGVPNSGTMSYGQSMPGTMMYMYTGPNGMPMYTMAPSYAMNYNYGQSTMGSNPTNTGTDGNGNGHGSGHGNGEAGHGSHFDYDNNAKDWVKDFPDCGGRNQSPIDIRQQDLVAGNLPPLSRKNYDVTPYQMFLENNGHALEVFGRWPEGLLPTISGGPLQGEFLFEQMHFHWGENDYSGSEHLVNGRRLPMELHLVNFNKKYGSFQRASESRNNDAIAVIGYFFQITPQPNMELQRLIDYMQAVQGSKTIQTEIPPMPLKVLHLDDLEQPGSFYATYYGSFTTPPCTEGVQFLISMVPLSVSPQQLHIMRNIVKDEHQLSFHNFRPPQPLNGRQVILAQA